MRLRQSYRFPVQVEQVDLVFRYLLAHAEELNLDMSRVCLSEGSAGTDLTEIYDLWVNREYAVKLGVEPVMTKENLKVLAIDETTLDCRVFDGNMYATSGCWKGAEGNAYEGVTVIMDVTAHITDSFIPTWVNASNEREKRLFYYQGKGYGSKTG